MIPFRNVLRITALAGFCLLGLGSANATTIERVVSPGGIEAWLVREPSVPLIAMEFAFAGGAAQDPPGKPGVANMTASLLDEGAGELDSGTFHESLERRAIELSFNETRDYIRGSLRTLKTNRDEAFDLLRLSLTRPRFDAEPVERIRNQILSSLRRQTTSPNEIASRRFFAAAFGQHPYGAPPDGTFDSVPKITVDDMRAYVGHVLARDTLKITVVGDIDKDALGILLDKTFGELPAKASLEPVADIVPKISDTRINVTLDVPQTVVNFGAPALKRDDPDFMTAYVLNHIMAGGGLTSRLYREVREKRGLVYAISESMLWLRHTGMLVGYTATRADRTSQTIDATTAELKRMAADGPTQQELDGAKAFLNGSQMLSLDTSSKIAGALLQYQLDGLGIDYLDRRPSIINAVTLEDAKRVAKRLWGQDFLTVAVGRVAEPTKN